MQQTNATIIVGGTLPLALVPKFCECIKFDMCRLTPDVTPDFKPEHAEHLLGACSVINNQQQLQLYATNSITGGFTLVEIFLLRNNMDYTLKSESVYGRGPFIVEARGAADFYFNAPTNNNFEVVVTQKDLHVLQAITNAEELRLAFETIIPDIPAIRPFYIATPQNSPDAN